MTYLTDIWAARYFWTHLALSDLRSRFRRSFFGVSWAVIQPLGLALLLSFVLSRIFKTDMRDSAPYVLSGIVAWEFITTTLIGGSLAFVQADAYIRQSTHPLAIYTLRTALTNGVVLVLASASLFLWVLLTTPEKIGWSWLAVLAFYPLMVLCGWAAATLLAYFAVRFRDIPHALGLLLQAVYFVSPIFFEARLFRDSGLGALVDRNPIYHFLQLIRAPLLNGSWPTLENYMFCVAFIAFLGMAAWAVGRRSERKVIFYL